MIDLLKRMFFIFILFSLHIYFDKMHFTQMFEYNTGMFFQLVIRTQSGELVERLSPWATYVVQPPREGGFVYKQRIYHPPPSQVLCYIQTYKYNL